MPLSRGAVKLNKNYMKSFGIGLMVLSIGLVVFMTVIYFPMQWYPQYRVYSQDLQGQANLRQQEWEKKIIIEQAKAQNESATLNAEARIKQATAEASAEIEKAKGVAEANRIIADSLKNNETYLHYLWLDKIGAQSQVIYVPTETGMPIMEAGKR